jgi:pimeloyl-ACP methyl ester carboxylesterase
MLCPMHPDEARARTLQGAGATIREIKAGGVSTSILEAGAGSPMLLLHGGVEGGSVIWAQVVGELAVSHRIVAPDLPGLGESAPMEVLDVDSFGRWLDDVLAATDLQRPTMVVHSVAGSLAARSAARAGGALGGLILCGVPGVGPYRMPLGLLSRAIRFSIRPTARNAERFDRFLLLDLDSTRARDEAWYAAFDEYNRTRAAEKQVKKTMSALLRLGKRVSDEELERIDAPVHLVWGANDRMVPVATGQAAAARHGWPLHIIDGAAHAPQIEQPAAFVDVIRRAAE